MVGRMVGRLPQLLHTHHAAIKAEWVERLRVIPPNTAMAHVDILVYRMDETLRELSRLLGKTTFKKLPPGHAQLIPTQVCPCRLNPLLDYFVTGANALTVMLPPLIPEEQSALARGWHALAQWEIDTLCSACCRRSEKCPGGARTQLVAAD